MRRGDPVIYQREPALYGAMTILLVRPNGRIVCALDLLDIATLPYGLELEQETEEFDVHELECIRRAA